MSNEQESKIAGAPTDYVPPVVEPPPVEIQEKPTSAHVVSPVAVSPETEQAHEALARRAEVTVDAMPAAPRAVSQDAQETHSLEQMIATRKRMQLEVERMETLSNELEGMLTREQEKKRLQVLRNMGVHAGLNDEQVLALAPTVDVSTPSGKASLDEWRQQNQGIFAQPTTQTVDVESLFEAMPERSKHSRLYDLTYFKKLMRDNLGE